MPQVPMYGQQRVQTSPIPGARVSTDAPIEAFGGGRAVDAAFGQAQGLAQDQTRQIVNQLQEAEEVALFEADRKLGEEQLRIESEARKVTGKDALTILPDQASKDFGTASKDIENSLGNESLKNAFRRRVAARGEGLNRAISHHADRELDRYLDEESKAYRFNALNAAALHGDDPVRVADEIGIIRKSIEKEGKRKGWSPATQKAVETEEVSRVHIAVIGALADNQKDQFAKAYFDKVQGSLTAQDRAQAQKVLEISSTEGEAQRFTDSIFNMEPEITPGGDAVMPRELSYGEVVGKVKEATKDNPKLRKAMMANVDQHFKEKKLSENYEQEELYNTWAKEIDKDPTRSAEQIVTPSARARMDPTTWDMLSKRAVAPTDDRDAWLDAYFIPPETLAKMPEKDFREKWSKLDGTHRARFEADREAAIKALGKPAELSSMLTDKDILNNAFVKNFVPNRVDKKDWTNADKLRYIDFEQFATNAVNEVERAAKPPRKLNQQEKQTVVDAAILKHKMRGDREVWAPIWGTFGTIKRKKQVSELSAEDLRVAYIGKEDIPQEAKLELANLAISYGALSAETPEREIWGAEADVPEMSIRIGRAYLAIQNGEEVNSPLVRSLLMGE